MRTFLFFIIQLLAIHVCAQTRQERTVTIYGPVRDYVTHNAIEGAKLTLMQSDSTVIDSCRNNYGYIEWRKLYSFRNLTVGKYILKAEKEGYETLYENIEVKKIYRREPYVLRDAIYLKRAEVHMLNVWMWWLQR